MISSQNILNKLIFVLELNQSVNKKMFFINVSREMKIDSDIHELRTTQVGNIANFGVIFKATSCDEILNFSMKSDRKGVELSSVTRFVSNILFDYFNSSN